MSPFPSPLTRGDPLERDKKSENTLRNRQNLAVSREKHSISRFSMKNGSYITVSGALQRSKRFATLSCVGNHPSCTLRDLNPYNSDVGEFLRKFESEHLEA